MNPSLSRCPALWCVAALVLFAASPRLAQAQDATPAPPPAVWISPTPDESGIISVIVQPDESLWIIAARAGLTLPDLLALNNLTESEVIRPGDVIIIAQGPPPPTVASPEMFTPSATPPPPTLRPTVRPATATVCLTAFEDSNQDGIHDPNEPTTSGVAFTVFNRNAVVGNIITDGRADPHCVPNLAPGEYYVTRSILPGEMLTTDGDWALVIANDSTLYQAFGSVRAPSTPAAVATAIVSAAETNPNVAGPAEPIATPSADPAPNNNALLWGGVGLLGVGGLLLLTAVLILLFRRTRTTP